MKPFLLEILTPSKIVFSGKVTGLTARAKDGEIGIVADHAPLATVLSKGRIRYRTDSGEDGSIETNEGILIVKGNVATALLHIR